MKVVDIKQNKFLSFLYGVEKFSLEPSPFLHRVKGINFLFSYIGLFLLITISGSVIILLTLPESNIILLYCLISMFILIGLKIYAKKKLWTLFG
jgi:hypothetical protein